MFFRGTMGNADEYTTASSKVLDLTYDRRKTREKRPLGRDPVRSWCHRHTTGIIKLFWSQPIAPWASTAESGQGEKFSA